MTALFKKNNLSQLFFVILPRLLNIMLSCPMRVAELQEIAMVMLATTYSFAFSTRDTSTKENSETNP